MNTTDDQSTAVLVQRMSEQVSRLVRDEIRLAKLDMSSKVTHAGIGIGMFSLGGLLAFFGIACLVGVAVAALALTFSVWLAALVTAAVLFAAAGIVALIGKQQVSNAMPPAPEAAIHGVKDDIHVIKESAHR